MNIRLSHVVPGPLKDAYGADSIWGKELLLEAPGYYVVNAASGKGKSTLLSYMYGLRNDFSGQLFLDERHTGQLSLKDWSQLRKSRLSMMFQDLRLFDDLTALQNIMLKAQLTNHTPQEKILEMAEQLGISGLLDRKARVLSMGQQQRVALIRVLVQPFEWLLLDEPFSHLDKGNIDKAEELINNACEANHAGLIVTTLGEKHGLPYKQLLSV